MGKPVVIFSKANHQGQEILLVEFPKDASLNVYLKKYDGISWSKSLKSFYLPYSRAATNDLFHYLRKEKYYIDYSALSFKKTTNSSTNEATKICLNPSIVPSVKQNISLFTTWMRQKRYSENTIVTYESMLLIFFRFHYPKTAVDISENDVARFNTDYIIANGFSYTYQNQMINAIKLFYRQQGSLTKVFEQLERPKKSKKLPVVLSIEEIQSILQNTINLKHKTLLSLVYSCGLRIGEALKLRLLDINYERRFMHVRCAKGSKDRYVPIPKQMVDLLVRYVQSCKPKEYVFEGQRGGMYSAVSARQILKRSLRLSNIPKEVTLHTLRHSHATHLLESGTDLRFIQELLGHNSPKTTMIYTHVSTASLDRIKNPFDDFDI